MKLPPMNALRAFEAVSRHLSVSKAAEELCVSQGAVSQQIHNLEDYLGRELFVRSHHSFSLTDEGEGFAIVVQQALTDIAQAASDVTRAKSPRKLTISVSPGIAGKWLMPRLGDFYKVHPNISIALDQSINLATFKNDGIDAGIRFSDGDFDGLDSVLLLRPQLFAVASPSYIAENGLLESLKSPGKHCLIDNQYSSKIVRSQHIHWQDLVSVELTDLDTRYLVFPDEVQSFNAALLGQGIALVNAHMIEEEIEKGIIQYANDQPTPARFSYYFVSPSDTRPNPALIAFRDWLVLETEKYRTAQP